MINVRLFKNPIKLKDIRKVYPKFRPPQSFYCLENEQFLKVRDYISKYESHNEINQ